MDTYIPLCDAAMLVNKSVEYLNQMINNHIIRAAKTSGGGILVCQEDVLSMLPIEDRPEYQEFIGLKDHGIGIREAEKKYNIPNPTLSRWAKADYIRVLNHGGRGQKTMLDESYVAYWAKIYHDNPGRGRWTVKKAGCLTKTTE